MNETLIKCYIDECDVTFGSLYNMARYLRDSHRPFRENPTTGKVECTIGGCISCREKRPLCGPRTVKHLLRCGTSLEAQRPRNINPDYPYAIFSLVDIINASVIWHKRCRCPTKICSYLGRKHLWRALGSDSQRF